MLVVEGYLFIIGTGKRVGLDVDTGIDSLHPSLSTWEAKVY